MGRGQKGSVLGNTWRGGSSPLSCVPPAPGSEQGLAEAAGNDHPCSHMGEHAFACHFVRPSPHFNKNSGRA